MNRKTISLALVTGLSICLARGEDQPTSNSGTAGFPKPYSAPCVERENVFEFAEKPKVKALGNDKYEITFAVKGNCDVTVGIVDEKGTVVRHLGAGVLGGNAPLPFQKNSLPATGGSASGGKQTIYWNGKDDLDEYHTTPEKLKVRVMLGLKPEFDKRLGGSSPYNIPGHVWGIAINEEAAYVFILGHHMSLRKFDREGRYLRSLLPPPADLPPEKLAGLNFIEYEQGVRAVHGPDINITTWGYADWLSGASSHGLTADCQPVIVGDRIIYGTSGHRSPDKFHWIHTDGSTDPAGVAGRPLGWPPHFFPRFAVSPDQKWLYFAGFEGQGGGGKDGVNHFVARLPVAAEGKTDVFAGEPNRPGSDNGKFNGANGVDCDAQGRVYVTDYFNNRLQVFSPEGKHLKTVPVERPYMIRVHQKNGALYVFHYRREEGKTLSCLSKLTSFDRPTVEYCVDRLETTTCAVDIWSPKTRLWTGGVRSGVDYAGGGVAYGGGPSVRIWEEDGQKLRMVMDFDEQAKKEDGENYLGHWSGAGWGGGGFGPGTGKVCADPTRERLYYGSQIFDLVSGRPSGSVKLPIADDIAFDKKGYLHAHISGCGGGILFPGVVRVDPSRTPRNNAESKSDTTGHPEVPYDYGEERADRNVTWLGVLPLKDQGGAKGFQDGFGVNMRGDVAAESNIYYVPKMDEYTRHAYGVDHEKRDSSYGGFLRMVQEKEKRGEALYSIRRCPGIPLAGGTVWTFDSHGELRQECAATAGDLINGVQIDEDGKLYFTTCRIAMRDGRPFLSSQAGVFGVPSEKGKPRVSTGTTIKSNGKYLKVLQKGAVVPLDEVPARPPELVAAYGETGPVWVEGAEWLYAGASPIVPAMVGCTCSTQRLHLDWYKRIYVPEAYRHTFGILDSNGNLIMHLGRYGNFDSASGPQSKIPVGGDGIGITMPRFITGTDNYLVFSDWGERLMVLKLKYHAEEMAGIGEVMSGK